MRATLSPRIRNRGEERMCFKRQVILNILFSKLHDEEITDEEHKNLCNETFRAKEMSALLELRERILK